MTFREFWPLYLWAHRLPGTRAMHYFATAIATLAAAEAVMVWQPVVLVAGIGLGYAVAIAAHRFVERNNPLIRINPLWGAIADLRMTWLALTGRLGKELAKHGVGESNSAGANHGPSAVTCSRSSTASVVGIEFAATERILVALDEFDQAARHALRYYGGKSHRYALLIATTAGLVAGLADLHDLIEHTNRPTYPILQLGAPVIAFAIAAASSYAALVVAGRHLRTVLDRFASLAAERPGGASTVETIRFGLRVERLFACEMSLRRAALALFVLGFVAFAGAEYAEHGLWWLA